MVFHDWLRRVQRVPGRNHGERRNGGPSKPVSFRPQVEPLEDRCVLSAGIHVWPVPILGGASIVTGADGNLWFGDQNGPSIWRMTPTGCLTEFSTGSESGGILDLASSPDGSIWFLN